LYLLVICKWRRKRTSYEPDAPRPVYILEKNQNVNRMGAIRFTFSKLLFQNVKSMIITKSKLIKPLFKICFTKYI